MQFRQYHGEMEGLLRSESLVRQFILSVLCYVAILGFVKKGCRSFPVLL